MIFKLDCVKYFFNDEDKAIYEKMGFKFKPYKASLCKDDYKWTKDGDTLPTLVVNDLEALKSWVQLFNIDEIIIDFDGMEIEIYDDYIE